MTFIAFLKISNTVRMSKTVLSSVFILTDKKSNCHVLLLASLGHNSKIHRVNSSEVNKTKITEPFHALWQGARGSLLYIS